MNEARKNRDQARTLLLSTILADLQNRDIELQRPVSDPEAVEVLRRGIKRRREAIEMYAKGGRKDLEAKEAAEIRMIEAFLPAEAAPEDIRAAVRDAIAGGARGPWQEGGQGVEDRKGRTDGRDVMYSTST